HGTLLLAIPILVLSAGSSLFGAALVSTAPAPERGLSTSGRRQRGGAPSTLRRNSVPHPAPTRRTRMSRRRPPPKIAYFEPFPPHLARNTIIESTFDVDRCFRCT